MPKRCTDSQYLCDLRAIATQSVTRKLSESSLCALILLRLRRYINHLLTYLLTYLLHDCTTILHWNNITTLL